MEVELLHAAEAPLGEGPIYDGRTARVYWIDIIGQRLFVFDELTGRTTTSATPTPVGNLALTEDTDEIYLAGANGFYSFNVPTGRSTKIADPLKLDPAVRTNEGRVDPQGRWWIGTMGYNGETNAGKFYRIGLHGEVDIVRPAVTIPNGIAWSKDLKTMYHIETRERVMRAFDYDNETGSIRNERVFIDFTGLTGGPDGMSIDAEGFFWVAFWGGSCVRRFDPKSRAVVREIPIPAKCVTSCTFGGKDLKSLYVTTAASGLSAEERRNNAEAGSLLRVHVDVPGVPEHICRVRFASAG